VKQSLVGTKLGNFFLEARRWWQLGGIPFGNLEKSSMIANSIIADRLIKRLCDPHGAFLDIGAHFGSVLYSVHRLDKTVKIFAIEADPRKAARLRNKFLFCTIFEVAVGQQAGQAEFFINPAATGYNTLVPRKDGNWRKIMVPIALLDDLLPETQIDVIKIDVEGAELGALKGGKSLIRRNRPTIMFESCGFGLNELGYSANLIWQWLHDMDYIIVTPDRLAHDAPPLALEAFIDAHYYPFRSQNFFALHRDRRKEVQNKSRKILNMK
jgi:FkbM family methyltransferase